MRIPITTLRASTKSTTTRTFLTCTTPRLADKPHSYDLRTTLKPTDSSAHVRVNKPGMDHNPTGMLVTGATGGSKSGPHATSDNSQSDSERQAHLDTTAEKHWGTTQKYQTEEEAYADQNHPKADADASGNKKK